MDRVGDSLIDDVSRAKRTEVWDCQHQGRNIRASG